MFDFHEKRKIRGWLFSKTAIGVLLILIGLLSFSVVERFSTYREITEKRGHKEAELRALQERAADLEGEVEYLKQKRGVEEELRSRFDVAKEGEQVVIIVDDTEDEEADLDELAHPPGERSSDYSWWSFLKFW